MNEQRKHPREKVRIKSEVHSEDMITYSTSSDLSKGGIFITTPEPPLQGSEVLLSLHFPGEEPVDIRGVVRWIRHEEADDQKTGMGVEFVEIVSTNSRTLRKYLKG